VIVSFVPMKWDLYFEDKQKGDFIITITGPGSQLFICRFRQLILKRCKRTFPHEFEPGGSVLQKGSYEVHMYVDGKKIAEAGFAVEANGEFSDLQITNSGILVYSSTKGKGVTHQDQD